MALWLASSNGPIDRPKVDVNTSFDLSQMGNDTSTNQTETETPRYLLCNLYSLKQLINVALIAYSFRGGNKYLH
jgi:hypothetical protein